MSKFFQALEQAERDRALREEGRPTRRPAADPSSDPAPSAPSDVAIVPPAPEPAPSPIRPAERRPAPSKDTRVVEREPERPAPPRPDAEAPVPARLAPSRTEEPVRLAEVGPAPLPVVEASSGVDGRLVSLLSPGTMEAEQYRALRHLIEQFHKTASLGVLAVTSPGAGDGKTTTAINLAGALAQDPGARVLLVDADLRAPALPQRLALDPVRGRGLVDAILDPRLGLEAVVRKAPPFNLSVLPAGRRAGVPYELLASPRFGELLDDARRAFDYVILDSPPLVVFPDCRLVGQWVDGFLLIVAAHRTPRKMVEEALGLIEPAKLVGLVFNADDRSLSSYYGDQYAYRYRQEEAVSTNGHGSGWLQSLRRGRSRAARAARRKAR